MTQSKAVMRLDCPSWIPHSMMALTDQRMHAPIGRTTRHIGLLSHESSAWFVNPILLFFTVRFISDPRWFWWSTESVLHPFCLDAGLWCLDQRPRCGPDRNDLKQNECADVALSWSVLKHPLVLLFYIILFFFIFLNVFFSLYPFE